MTPRTKAINTLQKLVRLKAANDNGLCQCVSCGNWAFWNEMDAGHFIPKGHSSYWALREENIHPQCKPCNGFGMKYGTAAHRYTLWMQDNYGRDFVDQMEQEKRNPVKYYKADYLEMIEKWKTEINTHLRRICR